MMRSIRLVHNPLLVVAVAVAAVLIAACGGSSPTAPSGGSAGNPAATPQPTPEPTPTPTPEPTPTPTPDPGPTVLREARFQSANGYFTEGRAAIVRELGGHRLEMRPDFRTSQSGALQVRLCRSPNCGPGDLNLGAIQFFNGVQRYTLPDASEQYGYAVIWCSAVSLPFGYGELR